MAPKSQGQTGVGEERVHMCWVMVGAQAKAATGYAGDKTGCRFPCTTASGPDTVLNVVGGDPPSLGMWTPMAQRLVPVGVWLGTRQEGTAKLHGAGHTEWWLCPLCPSSILTAAAGSISGGRGEVQLPQQSYCSPCPPGCSAGEGRESGRLRAAAGPDCTIRPALQASDAPPVPTPGTGGQRGWQWERVRVQSPMLSRGPLLPCPVTTQTLCERTR